MQKAKGGVFSFCILPSAFVRLRWEEVVKRLALALIAAAFATQGAAQSQGIPKPAFSIYFNGEVRSRLFPCG